MSGAELTETELLALEVEKLIVTTLMIKLDSILEWKTTDIRTGLRRMQAESGASDDVYKGAIITIAYAMGEDIGSNPVENGNLWELAIDAYCQQHKDDFHAIQKLMEDAQDISRMTRGAESIDRVHQLAREVATAMHGERWTRTGEPCVVSDAEVDSVKRWMLSR